MVYMEQQRWAQADRAFSDAQNCFRMNCFIDYTQLGLPIRLLLAQCAANRGVCLAAGGSPSAGLNVLAEVASSELLADTVADVAQQSRELIQLATARINARSYTPFPLHTGAPAVYRPSVEKAGSTQRQDLLGKSKIVASSDPSDNITGFKAAFLRRQQLAASGVATQPPPELTAISGQSAAVPGASPRQAGGPPPVGGPPSRRAGPPPVGGPPSRAGAAPDAGLPSNFTLSATARLDAGPERDIDLSAFAAAGTGRTFGRLRDLLAAALSVPSQADNWRLLRQDAVGDFVLMVDDEDVEIAIQDAVQAVRNRSPTERHCTIDLWVQSLS
ncbi:hypothetical protein, variant [Fonticula alba]|nr:hypothetical protein, variant [Fonticula alba]KCV73079.1 hypothetical protein, variant [Fonticula alba]|eukprot:XP_009492780.1 hypothetical protein, variant [Fonticula alba]